jgi:hypothetical protein
MLFLNMVCLTMALAFSFCFLQQGKKDSAFCRRAPLATLIWRSKWDIPQIFYGPPKATFMVAQHGDFIVPTYKKKETKNLINNSSHGLMGLGAPLIAIMLARSDRLWRRQVRRWDLSASPPVSFIGVWQGVAIDSLKFHLGPPCPTLLRLAGGPPL